MPHSSISLDKRERLSEAGVEIAPVRSDDGVSRSVPECAVCRNSEGGSIEELVDGGVSELRVSNPIGEPGEAARADTRIRVTVGAARFTGAAASTYLWVGAPWSEEIRISCCSGRYRGSPQ